ncbi:MAG: DUF433 domain-containing protein [Anaerolineales bacterium]|nr:DUF433 domain-containing protein [Anaerolineales bacterium]
MCATALKSARRTRHPYITRHPTVSGGKPVIAGTRLKVSQIALEYERLGWSPDQIVDAHPHLTLAQVHDALSYYYDHRQEIDAEILADEKFVAGLRKKYASRLLPANGR